MNYDEAIKETILMEENHIQLTKEKYDGLSVDKLDDLINRRKTHYKIINSALETAKERA